MRFFQLSQSKRAGLDYPESSDSGDPVRVVLVVLCSPVVAAACVVRHLTNNTSWKKTGCETSDATVVGETERANNSRPDSCSE